MDLSLLIAHLISARLREKREACPVSDNLTGMADYCVMLCGYVSGL
jgi:hypothetical protein